ncbi:MAG: beta-phosphoglucomutase [Clostridium sp.]|nr:beta-phosphoglucomutase [Clostridium sp.]
MNIGAVIFDLDGVLVDTTKYHYLAWKEILKEYDQEFTEEDYEHVKGVSRYKSLDMIFKGNEEKISEVERIKILRKKNNLYLQYIVDIEGNQVFKGVVEFLEKLKSKGYKTAIGSTSDSSYLIIESTGLSKYFDVIIDGYTVDKAKPHPEVYILAARELNINPHKCVVFEDSKAGVLAAKRAGMKVIGVNHRVSLDNADKMIDNFENLELDILDF